LPIPETRPWPHNEIPHRVEYSPEAFERLRLAALDGFLALPRIGMGIGGFLLGSRVAGRSRILDFLPIACSHADGPSFRLSAPEVAAAKELLRSIPSSSVLGFYCSKTRGKAGLSDEDLAVSAQLCPEPRHFALVLRPGMSEPSRAALFLKVKGKLTGAGEMELLPIEKSADPEDEVPEVPPVKPMLPPPMALKPEPISTPIPKLVTPPSAPSSVPPAATVLPVRHFKPPTFLSAPPAPIWPKMAVAGLLLFGAAGGAAWFSRDSWVSRPPLTLNVAEADRHVTFKWNPESVQGIRGVTLDVNDGGEVKSFALTAEMLERGHFVYDRKSGKVRGALHAGENRALAAFEEPVAREPVKPAR
jgi:hypothetical protein